MRTLPVLALPRLVLCRMAPQRAFLAQHSHTRDEKPDLSLFKEINEMGRRGLWDALNNKPKMGLCGKDKSDAHTVHAKYNKSTWIFDSSPYGWFFELLYRCGAVVFIVLAIRLTYRVVFSEEYRLAYKHRHQHGHDGGHGEHDAHGHDQHH